MEFLGLMTVLSQFFQKVCHWKNAGNLLRIDKVIDMSWRKSFWTQCKYFCILNIDLYEIYGYFVHFWICIFTVFSYKRDSTEKLKMSNGGSATDVYLFSSRCIRNNDKPVDYNVLTGRLPVSAGPQHHHQCQQQQQLLLMHADNNSHICADNGHSAWKDKLWSQYSNGFIIIVKVA